MDTRLKVEDGVLHVHTVGDVEDIIENNKRLQSIEQHSDWGRHKADIPNEIIMQWLNEEWMRGNLSMQLFDDEFNKLIGRKLRDPEWQHLRTDNSALTFKTGWVS